MRLRWALAFLALLLTSASAWKFFYADLLYKDLDKNVDQEVYVVDQVVKIWEEDSERPGHRSGLPIAEHWRFDTEHFTCAIPDANSTAIERVRKIFEESQKVKKDDGSFNYDRRPPLVAIKAKVMKAELWGNREEGENPWYILVVDEIESPRPKWYQDFYDARRP